MIKQALNSIRLLRYRFADAVHRRVPQELDARFVQALANNHMPTARYILRTGSRWGYLPDKNLLLDHMRDALQTGNDEKLDAILSAPDETGRRRISPDTPLPLTAGEEKERGVLYCLRHHQNDCLHILFRYGAKADALPGDREAPLMTGVLARNVGGTYLAFENNANPLIVKNDTFESLAEAAYAVGSSYLFNMVRKVSKNWEKKTQPRAASPSISDVASGVFHNLSAVTTETADTEAIPSRPTPSTPPPPKSATG